MNVYQLLKFSFQSLNMYIDSLWQQDFFWKHMDRVCLQFAIACYTSIARGYREIVTMDTDTAQAEPHLV